MDKVDQMLIEEDDRDEFLFLEVDDQNHESFVFQNQEIVEIILLFVQK